MAFQVAPGYVQSVADRASRQRQQAAQIGQLIGSLGKTSEEKFSLDVSDSVKDALRPMTSAYALDVAQWDNIDFGTVESAGKAWLKFKTEMEANGGRGYRWAKRKGLMDPIAFKQAYD